MAKSEIECPYCRHKFTYEIPQIYKILTIDCPRCNMPIKWSKPGIVEKAIAEEEIEEFSAPRDPGGILAADPKDL